MNAIIRERYVWLVSVVFCVMILTLSCISTQAFALESTSSTSSPTTVQRDQMQNAATIAASEDIDSASTASSAKQATSKGNKDTENVDAVTQSTSEAVVANDSEATTDDAVIDQETTESEAEMMESQKTSALINPQYVTMYRLYNKVSKEHLYTKDANEKAVLSKLSDWTYEGIGWYAPSEGAKVMRAYNPKSGEHVYTKDQNEINTLVNHFGWRNEGVAFYSGSSSMTKMSRFFNPNAGIGAHHYTTDSNEIRTLGWSGWKNEGVAWYTAVNQEYTNALNKAKSYMTIIHFSKDGLYDQLTSSYGEGFSSEAAQFAVDYVGADWKQSAVLRARDYSSVMNMSPSNIYDQLLYDKFTEEEARYGVEHM